jgi:hypothetical protein
LFAAKLHAILQRSWAKGREPGPATELFGRAALLDLLDG